MLSRARLPLAAIFVLALAPVSRAAVTSSVYASGLSSPAKVAVTSSGSLLVAESAVQSANGAFVPNHGRVSLITRAQQRRSLLEGLPSALGPTGDPDGPSAILPHGDRALFLVLGQGGIVQNNPQRQEAPNPRGLASALFSSIWRVTFASELDALEAPFVLNSTTDYATLADGKPLELKNRDGVRATLQVVAQLRTLYPAAPPNLVSGSHPYGLLRREGSLFLPDAAQNSIVAIPAGTGREITITHLPPVPNTAPFGPPVSDAVPTSLHSFGEDFALTTEFTGFPFNRGASSVQLIDLYTGAQRPFITGLTTAIDVLPLDPERANSPILVLEYSGGFNPATGFTGPGRLLRFNGRTSAPEVLVEELEAPSSMALDREGRKLYITEINSGRIVRVLF